jgi:hypothetical protein
VLVNQRKSPNRLAGTNHKEIEPIMVKSITAKPRRQARSLRKHNRPHEFAMMPTELCKRPPRLSPFGWNILVGLGAEGAFAFKAERHRTSLEAGSKPRPGEARQSAYCRHDERLRTEGIAAVVAKLTRRQALVRVGLAPRIRNYRKLDAELDRFTHEVEGCDRGPPLLKRTRLKHCLKLTINGEWLKPSWKRIPLPLPPTSQAIAMLLVFRTFNWRRSNKATVALVWFCDLIGMSMRNDRHAERRLRTTLDVLNKWARELPEEARQKAEIAESYDFIVDEHGDVRFTASGWLKAEEPVTDEQDYEMESEETLAERPRLKKPETVFDARDPTHAEVIEEDEKRERKSIEQVKRRRIADRAEEHKDYIPPMEHPRLKKPEPVDDDDMWRRGSDAVIYAYD